MSGVVRRVDAGSGGMTVTLVAPSGIRSVVPAATVTASGSGGTRAFNGAPVGAQQLFRAAPRACRGGFGPANLQITINDNGNTGSGGASASASVRLRGILFANGFE